MKTNDEDLKEGLKKSMSQPSKRKHPNDYCAFQSPHDGVCMKPSKPAKATGPYHKRNSEPAKAKHTKGGLKCMNQTDVTPSPAII